MMSISPTGLEAPSAHPVHGSRHEHSTYWSLAGVPVFTPSFPKSYSLRLQLIKRWLQETPNIPGSYAILFFTALNFMTNQDNVLKSRDLILLTKIHTDKAMVFPVVMYGCESSTIKKAEHQRINAFELWC